MNRLIHELLQTTESLRIVTTLSASMAPSSAIRSDLRRTTAILSDANITILQCLEREDMPLLRVTIAQLSRFIGDFYQTPGGQHVWKSSWWQSNGHNLTIRIADTAKRVIYLLGDEAA